MAVEARAVFDLKPAHHDVPAEPSVLAQHVLVVRINRAFDLALDGHVGRVDRDPGRRARGHVQVAGYPELALGAAVDVYVTFVDQLALEAIVRPHRELALPAAAPGVAIVLGRSHRRAFCHRLLNVHHIQSPPDLNRPDVGRSQALKVSPGRLQFADADVELCQATKYKCINRYPANSPSKPLAPGVGVREAIAMYGSCPYPSCMRRGWSRIRMRHSSSWLRWQSIARRFIITPSDPRPKTTSNPPCPPSSPPLPPPQSPKGSLYTP